MVTYSMPKKLKPFVLKVFELPADPKKAKSCLRRRYSDWLPVPDYCHLCNSPVVMLRNRVVYGKDSGFWPFVYWCLGCGANTGVHNGSIYPKGKLADKETRAARIRAHALFDPLWQENHMTRSEAYTYLGHLMGRAPDDQIHIGNLDAEECMEVVDCLMAHWLSLNGGQTTMRVLGFSDTSEEDFPWS